ncbi:hypothetical protein OKA04_04560 [Luteolibacter flavescens]|uniref:Uncharacterized protein n=1 Tax=Luteolibacter flavescens TaxID=1859460 RepID=A0ABT3FK73_9BACT|nr:hypothetical protein [Luteolibacter flavescens]MCW1883988.1 hypothetical protein [Luteolibacter flavescens]
MNTSTPQPVRRNASLVQRIREAVADKQHPDELSALLAHAKLEGDKDFFARELGLSLVDYRMCLERAKELLRTDTGFSATFFSLNRQLHL